MTEAAETALTVLREARRPSCASIKFASANGLCAYVNAA